MKRPNDVADIEAVSKQIGPIIDHVKNGNSGKFVEE